MLLHAVMLLRDVFQVVSAGQFQTGALVGSSMQQNKTMRKQFRRWLNPGGIASGECSNRVSMVEAQMNDKINSIFLSSERVTLLKAEIGALQGNLQTASLKKQAANIKRADAKRAIELFSTRRGGNNFSDQDKSKLKHLNRCYEEELQASEQADGVHHGISTRLKALSNELNELNELESSETIVTFDDVKNALEDIKFAQGDVDSIKAIIDKYAEVVHASSGSRQHLNLLHQRRDTLHAEFALGEGSEADLKALDEDIANEKVKADKIDERASDAESVGRGLQSKLSSKTEALATLKRMLREVVFQFLECEMDKLVIEYSLQADPVIEAFKKLHKFNRLMVDTFDCKSITGDYHIQMCIPSFSMSERSGSTDTPGELFSYHQGMANGQLDNMKVDVFERMYDLEILN
ncbi:MAG: hypothetical protein R8M38_09865 [Mariprofundaceae bacterium]